jgi:uncharacterized protein
MMDLFFPIAKNKMPAESQAIAVAVKKIVLLYDANAQTILFGSRARGDAGYESDWDFLVLTDEVDTENLAMLLRKAIREKIELIYLESISLIVKNKKVWQDDYAVTNIYASIAEEGIVV